MRRNVFLKGGKMRRYGLGNFIWDCLLTFITCGFWLIWVFVREMQARKVVA